MVTRILTILLLFATSCSAVEVTFVEPPPKDQGAVRQVVQALATKDESLPSIADLVVALLQRDGYVDAEVTTERDSLRVEAGSRYTLVSVVSAGSTDTVSLGDLPFTPDVVSQVAQSVANSVEAIGHYYARVRIVDALVHDTQVTLVVTIEPGPTVTVKDLEYTGLARTKAGTVDRYVSVQRGDSLTEALVDESQRSASNIPFLHLVSPIQVRPLPGYTETNLLYRFEEVRQFEIEGVGGYVPDDPVGLVWTVNLSVNNLFGDGRRIAMKSERRERGRNALDLDYWQPMFWLGVGSLEAKVSTRDYRDDFYEFGVSGTYNTNITKEVASGLTLQARHVEPSDIGRAYSAYSAEFSIARDSRDNRLNPSRGFDLSAAVAYDYRHYSTSPADTITYSGNVFNETRSRLHIGYYQPLPRHFVAHFNVRYMGLETSEDLPPLSELFLIGGPGNLRGYRTDQFAAQRAALATVEPRWRFGSGFLFAFYDAAYLNRRVRGVNGSVTTDEQYRDSFGGGLRVINDRRFVTLSLGWNGEDPFDQPRLAVELGAGL